MNQRVAVRSIIRQDGKTLLLRRAGGRSSILGKYELPGGRLEYGEQPEDSLTKYLKNDVGLTIQSAQLFDVVTYIDHDQDNMQYVLILYLVGLESNDSKLSLGQKYDHFVWKKVSNLQQNDVTESTKLLLGISQQQLHSVKQAEVVGNDVLETSNISHAIVYSDGGSRGNPGPSASGYVVMDSEENVVHEGGMYLGITTNNQAEYHGVRLGLEKALAMGVKSVDFRMDSLLIVNQMNGVYKIKNRDLWPIHERIRELMTKFEKVTFTHVRREFNQLADGMINKILDAHAK